MLTINLKKSLTRIEAEEAVWKAIPELDGLELSMSDNGDGTWWWGTIDYKHEWSGYVLATGQVSGPY